MLVILLVVFFSWKTSLFLPEKHYIPRFIHSLTCPYYPVNDFSSIITQSSSLHSSEKLWDKSVIVLLEVIFCKSGMVTFNFFSMSFYKPLSIVLLKYAFVSWVNRLGSTGQVAKNNCLFWIVFLFFTTSCSFRQDE